MEKISEIPDFFVAIKGRDTSLGASSLVHNHYYFKISTNLCVCFHDIILYFFFVRFGFVITSYHALVVIWYSL